MKSCFLLLFLVSLCLSSFTYASDSIDEAAQTFHTRMIEREAQIYRGAEFILVDEVPSDILETEEKAFNELLAFATRFDLFALGFSYEIDPRTYQAIKNNSSIGYTFSLIISKDGKPMTRRFYNLSRRVDGVFYVDHIANYDI